ncbi:MAG: AIR synthase related protein [Saprospiraceae bacterium]
MYKYDQRGVSATKDEVHQAIKNLDKGLFELAFCKLLPDYVGSDPEYCNIMHADTAGTKTSLAYIYWKETNDLSVWEGIAQDAIVMNLDDMACVGCTDNIILSSTIGRNRNLISGDVISTLINATVAFADKMRDFGVDIHLAGGETADVGDIVRTIDVGYTAFARMKRKDLIINNIQSGDVIVGMASYGQAIYESSYNGGMGSNGLTSARHDVFHRDYALKYPDSYDHNTPENVIYNGKKRLTDPINVNGSLIDAGKLVLSPTRTFLPVLKQILAECRPFIHGMIHCTGGGQAKVLKFVENKRVVKDNLFSTPPLFSMIQEESGTSWEEMYQVFNMGNRMEIYTDYASAQRMIELSNSFGIEAQIIGYVEEAEKNQVIVRSVHGEFVYQ